MNFFDEKTWKDRAWNKFTRTVRSISAKDKESQSLAEWKWHNEVNAINDLKKLIAWCEKRGLSVKFMKKSMATYTHSAKEIEVSSHLPPPSQLIVLLHECGHHLIGGAEKHVRFSMGYPQTDPDAKKTFQHRVTILDEEMEAWHRGWKLACRLGLRLNRDEFDKVRLGCVKSYVKWALKPGPHDSNEED